MTGWIGGLGDQLRGDAIWLVFPLALFVLHYSALQVERLLINGSKQVPHAIRFEPERVIQRRARNILKIIRAVGIGSAVQIGGSDRLHRFDVPTRVMLAAAEHQVLEQMRKPGLSGPLVFRSDV